VSPGNALLDRLEGILFWGTLFLWQIAAQSRRNAGSDAHLRTLGRCVSSQIFFHNLEVYSSVEWISEEWRRGHDQLG
jgi:hypothetical protein